MGLKPILFFTCPKCFRNVACLYRKGVGSADLRHCPCPDQGQCHNEHALTSLCFTHKCS